MSKHSQTQGRSPDQRSQVNVAGHCLCVDHPADIAEREGPLWLFIHGIAASAGFWPPLMPEEFRHNAAWVSASLPVHGTSTGPASFSRRDVTPDLFVSVYQAVIKRFGGDRPVIVVGHSTGGYAGLCLAHDLPDQVTSVVSAGGFADGRWEGLEGMMQEWAREERLGRFGPHLLRIMSAVSTRLPSLQRRAASQFAVDKATFLTDGPTAESLEAVRADARYSNAEHLIEFFAGIRDADIWDRIGHILQPVLVIDGARDPVIPAAHSRKLAASLPNAVLRLYADAGHMIMNERREEFWAELMSWSGKKSNVMETI